MAVLSLKDAVITINAIALSDRTNNVTLNYEVDSIELYYHFGLFDII